jgi:hypothetical protein
MDGRPLLTGLSDEDRVTVLQRYELLRPHIEGGVPLPALVRSNGIPLRTVSRLFNQIERVLKINELQAITKEVVEAARENLVIGPL